MTQSTKDITTLTKEANKEVEHQYNENLEDGKTGIDFPKPSVSNPRKEKRDAVVHIINELNKLNEVSDSIEFLTDWTGENLVIVCADKNIELNFTLHHSTTLDAENSMVNEMGVFVNELNTIIEKGKVFPDDFLTHPPEPEWVHHPKWGVNRDLRKGGHVHYPEITHSDDFLPAVLANYEIVFSAKAVAAVGGGDPLRGAKILSFMNSYLSHD